MKFLEMKSAQYELKVAKLVMGSSMSMGRLSKEEIFSVFDRYAEAGGNCIDTARAYDSGKSEEMVGQWLKERNKGNQMIISTKGGHPIGHDMKNIRLSKTELEYDLDLSLKALNKDEIDIYWLHKDDPTRPVEDIIETINEFLKSGKVKFIGCSNWHIDRIEQANKYAKEKGLQGLMASQVQWSFTDTLEEHFKQYGAVVMDSVSYDWYYLNKMPVFAFSSQAQGFFARIASNGIDSLRPDLRAAYETPENMVRYERVKEYANHYNVPISAPILGYLINNKLPGAAIIGAENIEQLEQSLTAVDIEMTAEEADKLFIV